MSTPNTIPVLVSNATPAAAPTTTEYRVFFLSGRTGRWQLHHAFQSREFATQSAVTISEYGRSVVNETVVDARGRILSENQIFEAPRAVAS